VDTLDRCHSVPSYVSLLLTEQEESGEIKRSSHWVHQNVSCDGEDNLLLGCFASEVAGTGAYVRFSLYLPSAPFGFQLAGLLPGNPGRADYDTGVQSTVHEESDVSTQVTSKVRDSRREHMMSKYTPHKTPFVKRIPATFAGRTRLFCRHHDEQHECKHH
jgi:hypothetical protein